MDNKESTIYAELDYRAPEGAASGRNGGGLYGKHEISDTTLYTWRPNTEARMCMVAGTAVPI